VNAVALRHAAAAAGGEERRAVYLHPGHLVAAGEPTAVTTILGSCVGVFLWDARAGVGGVNHYLLPDLPPYTHPSPRFGEVALPRLLADVLAAGASRMRLRARVFGGACVLSAFHAPGHLGERNAELAMRFLDDHAIPVDERRTGGRRGRRVLFHTDDGFAAVREI
jgi:chemotaxis protein CheD